MKHKKPAKNAAKAPRPAFVVFGHHAVEKAIQAGRVELLMCDSGRQDQRMQDTLAQYSGQVMQMDKTQLNDKVGHSMHQGIVAEVKAPPVLSESALEDVLQNAEKPFFFDIRSGSRPA